MANKRNTIFADFTMNRINRALERSPLSDAQAKQIHSVLAAEDADSKHSLDVRFSLPLYFRTYYLVLVAGRDRRRSQFLVEKARLARLPKPLLRIFLFLALFLLCVALVTGVFVALYMLKAMMNIDLIPGFHLTDLFK